MFDEVGQHVVCVNGDPTDSAGLPNYPKKGAVYTIRDVAEHKGDLGCWLVELVNPPIRNEAGHRERGFVQTRFRALDEKRLDVFREMLAEEEPAEQHA